MHNNNARICSPRLGILLTVQGQQESSHSFGANSFLTDVSSVDTLVNEYFAYSLLFFSCSMVNYELRFSNRFLQSSLFQVLQIPYPKIPPSSNTFSGTLGKNAYLGILVALDARRPI